VVAISSINFFTRVQTIIIMIYTHLQTARAVIN